MSREKLRLTQQENKTPNRKVYYIQKLQSYKKSLTPSVNKQNRWKVQKKVRLDKQAFEKFKDRQIKNNLYLKYDINPFTPLKKKQKHDLLKKINKSRQKITQVIQLITPDEKRQIKIKRQINDKLRQLQKIKTQANLRSQKLLNLIKKNKYEKQSRNHEIMQQVPLSRQKDERLQNMQLQEILDIKQSRYMFDENQRPNIFKLMTDDSCIGMMDYLNRYNFCYDSHIQRNYKIRIPIYRQLSTMGRQVAANSYNGKQKIIDYVFSDQLTLNMKELSYAEVQSIASNRLTSQFIYNKLFEDNSKPANEVSDQISQEQSNELVYRKTDRIHFDNFVAGDQEIQEIEAYKKIEITIPQKRWKNRNEDMRNQVIQQLQIQNQLCLNNIMDMRLHSTMGENTKQKLKRYIVSKQKKNEQFQRIVRQKKKMNDKKQLIRLRQFKRMLEQKNKYQKLKSSFSRGKLNNTVRL